MLDNKSAQSTQYLGENDKIKQYQYLQGLENCKENRNKSKTRKRN